MVSRAIPTPALRVLGLVVAAAALAAGQAGCRKPTAEQCASGLYCPADKRCSGNGKECIDTPCGNGDPSTGAPNDPGEVCDDGGTSPFDENLAATVHARCSADCKSDQTCGNGVFDPQAGEVCDYTVAPWLGTGTCDDGTTNPLDACKVLTAHCGDGILQGDASDPEECDDGAARNGQKANCLPYICKLNVCGDGYRNETNMNTSGVGSFVRKEDCDGGHESIFVQSMDCPYDAEKRSIDWSDDSHDWICSQCRKVGCTLHYCGDGHVDWDDGERCDAGDSGSSCVYGETTCPSCENHCTVLRTVPGKFCGNGKIDDPFLEDCDGTASFACGTCASPDGKHGTACKSLGLGQASGTITLLQTNLENVRFRVSDDVMHTAMEFELTSGTAGAGRVKVSLAGGGDDIARAIASAVGDNVSGVSAYADRWVVHVLRGIPGIRGNAPLWTSDSGRLAVSGMAGGRGCSPGQPCTDDHDCSASSCEDGFCR